MLIEIIYFISPGNNTINNTYHGLPVRLITLCVINILTNWFNLIITRTWNNKDIEYTKYVDHGWKSWSEWPTMPSLVVVSEMSVCGQCIV